MDTNQVPVAGSLTSVEAITNTFIVALCIYREARGESPEARRAVGCVIRNRVQRPAWWGKDWFSVVTKSFQFSSFNKGEPNSVVFGAPGDPVWEDCYNAALDVINGTQPDITGGATFYFSVPIQIEPVWATKYKHLCDIGAFRFFTDLI